MNKIGLIKVKCRYYINNGYKVCSSKLVPFNCSIIPCSTEILVYWSYYLVNARHLLEVKDE